MTRKSGWQAAVGAALLLLAQGSIADDNVNRHARDLKILTEWFAGEFDNEEQRWFENDPRAAVPEDEREIRVHTTHRRIDMPTLGEHVFYVEEYRDNDPAKVFRQRLVTFSARGESATIEMRQGFFSNAQALVGAAREPSKLADLTAEDVRFMNDIDPSSDCTVHWRRVGAQFHGAMAPKKCVFGEGEKRRYSIHNLVLSEDHYWREDGSYYLANDAHAAGSRRGAYTQMRRANEFVCQVTFRSEDGSSQTVEDLRLMSQGGTFEVARESDGKVFAALLRDKQYPYYDERPDFIYFSFREKGAARSLVYTVHDVDSRRLGFNTQGIGAHCHRRGYEFREPINEL